MRAGEFVLFGRTVQSIIRQLYRVPASGGTPQPLAFATNGSAVDTFPGTGALVYCLDQQSVNIWRVGAWPGTDRQPRKWIASDMPSVSPAISRAGDRIAFASSRSGVWTIYASDAGGNGGSPIVRFPDGRHDDGWLSFLVAGWQADRLRRLHRHLSEHLRRLGRFGDAAAPDGGHHSRLVSRWPLIYYSSDLAGSQTVRRVPASGGKPQQITSGGGFSVKISPDGKYVYYLKGRVEGELWRAPAGGGDEELLVRELKSRNFWVLPDGVYMLDPGVSELSPMNRGRARFYRFRTRKVEDLGFETQKPINAWGICLSPTASGCIIRRRSQRQ
jgi:hypothetical protein